MNRGKLSKRWIDLAVWATGILATMLLFGPAFFHPGEYLFSSIGDGLKAYYNLAWYLQHGAGTINHSFQYPLGNHMGFTDQNAILTWVLRLLGPGISVKTCIFAINSLIIWSLPVATWVLYRLFIRMGLPLMWAWAFSLPLVFMSPQMVRIAGHYSLAIFCFFPIVWWWTLDWFEGKKRHLRSVLLALIWTIAGFFHPYLLLMGIGFFGCYGVAWFIQGNKISEALSWLSAAVALLTPLLILQLWVKTTWSGPEDYVLAPFGQTYYSTGFEGIFLPSISPFSEVWNFFIDIRKFDLEGWLYVGFPGLLILGFLLYRIFFLLRNKRGNRILKPVWPKVLRTSIWAGVIMGFVAAALPLKWFPILMEYLGPFRQFRALGRLGLPFYFVFVSVTLHLLYAGYRMLRQRGFKKLGIALAVGAWISWSLYALAFAKMERNYFLPNQVEKLQDWSLPYADNLRAAGIETTDYQAILALPFFHHGSEKIVLMENQVERAAMALALQTGLPLCDNLSARVPITTLEHSLEWTAHPLIAREFLSQIPSTKLILLAYLPEFAYDPGAKALIGKSHFLMDQGPLRIASLSLSAFPEMHQESIEAAKATISNMKAINGGLYFSDTTSWAFFNGFGDNFGDMGTNAIIVHNESKVLGETLLPPKKEGPWKIEASVWIRLDQKWNYLPDMIVERYQGETLVYKQKISLLQARDTHNGWILGKAIFDALPGENVRFSMKNKWSVMDHLLVRPIENEVAFLAKGDTVWHFNNYPLVQ